MGYTYCMSDVHGEVDYYNRMLRKIDFRDDDTLYILGDIIDRKKHGVEILFDVMSRKNVVALLGNHEHMCYATLGPNNVFGARELWKQNGGNTTYRELVYRRTPQERRQVLQFIAQMPLSVEISVAGTTFYLVHGFPSDDKETALWDRVEADTPRPFADKTVIVGHTPTPYLTDDFNEVYRIWHGDGIIDIDCGCGNTTNRRRLGCLRLDDMTEFYVGDNE